MAELFDCPCDSLFLPTHVANIKPTKNHPQNVLSTLNTCERQCNAKPYDSQQHHISNQSTKPNFDDIRLPKSNRECVLTYAQVVSNGILVKDLGHSKSQSKNVTSNKNPSKSKIIPQDQSFQLLHDLSPDIPKRVFTFNCQDCCKIDDGSFNSDISQYDVPPILSRLENYGDIVTI